MASRRDGVAGRCCALRRLAARVAMARPASRCSRRHLRALQKVYTAATGGQRLTHTIRVWAKAHERPGDPLPRRRAHLMLAADVTDACVRLPQRCVASEGGFPGGCHPSHTLPASWRWPAPGGWRDWATATLSGADSGGAQGWTMPGIRVAGPGPWHGRAQCLSIVAHRRRRVPGRRNPRAEE